ncbi:hypothetical protein Prudu_222S000200 [Prunus dulcis]|uniref:Uncharacterized protein n=1 Tax=Prunus dulcis TaxID=3755 RepID=A0A5H2XLS2_PRUDU|nr:hypothetical protein Prudu_222S000200 [Prunus dulcis]
MDRLGFDGSWIGVPDTPNSQTLDLIRHRRAVMTTQSSEPPAQPTSAATAPALMDHLAVGPRGPRRLLHQLHQWRSLLAPGGVIGTPVPPTPHPLMRRAKKNTQGQCRQLRTAKVTWVTNSRINIGYDERHRAAPTTELHSSLAHDIGHVIRSHCPMKWKSWKVMPDETKTEVRCQLSWKSDLHHYFEAFDDPQVTLQEGCPKELEGREDSWAWLYAHFQAPAFVNKAKVNKGNRKKKTLIHHSGSRPFSYRMDAAAGGSKFPEIDVFGDVYVRPGNELAESLHTTMVERSQLASSGVHLPTSSRYSDRVCGSSTRCWVLDLDRDIGSDYREETRDILSRDGECQAEGTQTPFISAVKQSGHCFDSTGGHSSESDVGHSAVPRTVRHSSPAF